MADPNDLRDLSTFSRQGWGKGDKVRGTWPHVLRDALVVPGGPGGTEYVEIHSLLILIPVNQHFATMLN